MRHSVPSITQYASAALIAGITYGGHPRGEDPRWRESGATDQETYAAWCSRWCGMACFLAGPATATIDGAPIAIAFVQA